MLIWNFYAVYICQLQPSLFVLSIRYVSVPDIAFSQLNTNATYSGVLRQFIQLMIGMTQDLTASEKELGQQQQVFLSTLEKKGSDLRCKNVGMSVILGRCCWYANRIVRDAEAMHVSLILFSIHFILNEKIFQNNNEKEK